MEHWVVRLVGTLIAVGLGLHGAQADVITDWNTVLLHTLRTTATTPPEATRALAMLHVALFEAVNAQPTRYVPYHRPGRPPRRYAIRAAVAQAAYGVLTHLYPAQEPVFAAVRAQALQGLSAARRHQSLLWGQACAEALIALRAQDGATADGAAVLPQGPGFWVPTPPAGAPALLPHWPAVTPWVLADGAQFRGPPPPPLTSAAYAAAFQEVATRGAATSATRTPDQTTMALFWADGPGTVTPPGHWNVIAQQLAQVHGTTVRENARLFALLNVALADAATAAWDTKYAYAHWRPVTGIRQAASDENAATLPDPTWTPLLVTPPFPAYPSGHSTFSAAAATILAAVFGTDAVPFTTTADGLPGVTRTFPSLAAAAEEAGQSRLVGGIHWAYDHQEGRVLGQAVATYVLDHVFGLRGDLDQGGQVDGADFLQLLAAWGPCAGRCPTDLSGNGVVNSVDLVLLLQRWTE